MAHLRRKLARSSRARAAAGSTECWVWPAAVSLHERQWAAPAGLSTLPSLAPSGEHDGHDIVLAVWCLLLLCSTRDILVTTVHCRSPSSLDACRVRGAPLAPSAAKIDVPRCFTTDCLRARAVALTSAHTSSYTVAMGVGTILSFSSPFRCLVCMEVVGKSIMRGARAHDNDFTTLG